MGILDRDSLISAAQRHSPKMGVAVEAVLKAEKHPTRGETERLYKLLTRGGGDRLPPDIFMALIEALRR